MGNMVAITDVVLDFDGTCTQIPLVYKDYLERYRLKFVEVVESLSESEWKEAQTIVCQVSPKAGWMVGGCPAAPAAADPYILADESAKFVLRRRGKKNVPLPPLNASVYSATPAPWRNEALSTFLRLIERGVRLHFISNSSTTMIQERLSQLFGGNNSLPDAISVQSDAGKFRICELAWDENILLPLEAQARFLALPATYGDLSMQGLERPIYLRRGAYFEAIYRALRGNLDVLNSTVFCGDIWEMDLAMPYALGANVHFVERAAPFQTYAYEREALKECGSRGKASADLSGLLEWL